jgi:WhiB family redox-sensing transcriptional regulator
MKRSGEIEIDLTWQQDAKCKGIPTEEFYPGRGQVISWKLRDCCSACPVKEACLDHALNHEMYGFWGGTTEHQRRSIRQMKGISLIKPETVYWYGETESRQRIEDNRPKIKGRGRKPVTCGTYSGYKKHRKLEEEACEPCKRANTDYIIALKKRKKGEAEEELWESE